MFVPPEAYDPKAIKEKWNADSPAILKDFAELSHLNYQIHQIYQIT